MTKELIRDKIIEHEIRINGFDRLSGVGVEIKNLRITKKKAIADIVLHTDYEDGTSERYDNCEYPLVKLLK